MQSNEDSTETTLPQSDGKHCENELQLIDSELSIMAEAVTERSTEGSSSEQILTDFVSSVSSQTEINTTTTTNNDVYCETVLPQDDKGHDILSNYGHLERSEEEEEEEEEAYQIEKIAVINEDCALTDCNSLTSDIASVSPADGVSLMVMDTKTDTTLPATRLEDTNGDHLLSVGGTDDDVFKTITSEGTVNTQLPPSVAILEESTILPTLSPPVVTSRAEKQRTVTQLMLPESIREKISELFTAVSGEKISPMWENNPWVEYLVFLAAVIPKDECISLVETLIKFFMDNESSRSSLSEQIIEQGEHNLGGGDQTTSFFQKEDGSAEIVIRLLQDFYCHVLTKVPGRMEDEVKAKEQAAIITAIYFCILSDYRKLAASTSLAANNESGDATAAFFLACMPTEERNLLLSSKVDMDKAANNGSLKSFNDKCESLTGETSFQSRSKNSQALSPESPADYSSSSGSNMVNHVGSLIRKKLHLDSKSSKHADSADISNKVRSPLKRFSKSSSALPKQKSLDSPPKQLQEVAEGDDYTVCIHREMLGLTVENVLERTIIRTVLPNGAAKKSGAKVGSLIVKVGGVSTYPLTHFETIDELRRSNRPLKLDLRMISAVALKEARGEMGRLIRGGEFGRESHVKAHMEERDCDDIRRTLSSEEDQQKGVSAVDEHSESYDTSTNHVEKSNNNMATKSGIWKLISYRWNMPMQSVVAEMRLSKKEKAISKVRSARGLIFLNLYNTIGKLF
jgi:hypothetical protein